MNTVCLQPSIEVVLLVFCLRDHLWVVHGIVHLWFEGLQVRSTLTCVLPLHSGVGNDRDPNLICIFILFLGDRRAIFLFSTTFPNSGIMSSSMSRCRLRSRSHVDVRVMFLLCFPRVLLQFSSLMAWCHFLQGSENRSALAVDDLLTVPWASP